MTKYKPFNELKFDLEPVLYDAKADSIIPFEMKGRLIAHKLKAISDERYLQRDKESFVIGAHGDVLAPTIALWRDVVIERFNCIDSEGWRDKASQEQIISALAGYTHIRQADEMEPDDSPLSDEENYTLNFTVFYGGITLAEWQEWFISGHFPSNINLTSKTYLNCLEFLNKGISFRYYLPVSFEFSPTITAAQREEFLLIQSNSPKNLLASAARTKETQLERTLSLFNQVEQGAKGYKNRTPVWHKKFACDAFFSMKFEELGKSMVS